MLPVLIIVGIVLVLMLLVGFKFFAGIIGILLGWFILSISSRGHPLKDCFEHFNCSGGQIVGLLLVIISIVYIFKPSLFSKIFGG